MSTDALLSDDSSTDELIRQDIVEAIASNLDLRKPNKEALESIAAAVANHYEVEKRSELFEGVVDVATGVGKTYVAAAALEYFAALGSHNFAIIAPGRTILNKTVANFTPGHRKSVKGMEVKPVVITSENFDSAAKGAVMDDPDQVKLFIFTVQSLIKPTTDTGRKTREFREGLGKAFYEHLQTLDDLIVFADEHHIYYGPSFSDAIRALAPYALIGLTATPHRRTPEEQIIYRYPVAAAIADKLVKTPVVVGRKDDRSDIATRLNDGIALLEAKRATVESYVKTRKANGEEVETVNPVMLVITPNIEDAKEIARLLRESSFAGGRYADSVLEVHSKETGDKHEKMLADLENVEDPNSRVRVIVSVGMLKEGWDVKNVYVIASLRPSISDILTEQTLGRGMRLPFGAYTDIEMLDTLEVLAHAKYEQLLKKTGVLNQGFIDHRTYAVLRRNMSGELTATLESTPVETPIVISEDGAIDADAPGPTLTSVEDRTVEAQDEAEKMQLELLPDAKYPTVKLPHFAIGNVESSFSLADLTELDAFRKLGERFASDPGRELRRERLSATVVTGPDGLLTTKLVTGQAVDRIEPSLLPVSLDESRKELLRRIFAAEIVVQRPKERNAAKPIIEAFVEGLGDNAELVLGGYLDRAAASLLRKIVEQQRNTDSKPRYDKIVGFIPFGPVRQGRAETSSDRTGKFKKGVGYEGWKKSLYAQVWFDSDTERAVATILDDSDEIEYWARLHQNDLSITWEGGSYNPDFIAVEKDGTHWVVEPKMEKEMASASVKGKKEAARRWASHVSSDEKAESKWQYLLLSESDIKAAKGSWPALKKMGAGN
ncbi:MAG: DEAD/DEAH box helicase family protein [Gaiellaceae bacterium]